MTHSASPKTDQSLVKFTNPAGLYDPAPNGYSHLGEIANGARLVFIAGQGGETVDGALTDDFETQVEQAFDNLLIALAAAGGRAEDIVKLTVLIVDHSEARLHVFGSILSRKIDTLLKPTCTLIPVPRLALDGMLFEVEAVAAIVVD
jgi:enamine deaminase RidA (YjgF/YER057c/UK114 family)